MIAPSRRTGLGIPFALLLVAAVSTAPLGAQGRHRIEILAATFAEPPGTTGSTLVNVRVRFERDTTLGGRDGSTRFRIQAPTGVPAATVGTNTGCARGEDVSLNQDILSWSATEPDGERDLPIQLCADALDEFDEVFELVAIEPSYNVSVSAIPTRFTITDDPGDLPPQLSISGGGAVTEGAVGTTTTRSFTVSLSGRSGKEVSVPVSLAGVTRAAACSTDPETPNPVDILSTTTPASPLVIPAGETSRTVTVTVCGDALPEPDETFTVQLGTPSNAGLGTASATGTIINDDPFPRIAIAADRGSVKEGTGAGSTTVTFRLSIDRAPVGLSAAVQLSFGGVGSAVIVGTDCSDPRTDVAVPQTSQRVQWAVGSTTAQEFTATVCRDDRDDVDLETFHATLGGFERAINDGPIRADVVIQDDDDPPTVSILDGTVTEPATAGTETRASVTLRLSAASNRPIPLIVVTRQAEIPAGSLEAATVAAMGTSSCGQTVTMGSGTTTADFVRRFGTVTIEPGQVTATFGDIRICHDGRSEGVVARSNPGSPVNRNAFANMEQFEVYISSIAGPDGVVTLGDRVARVVIRDN